MLQRKHFKVTGHICAGENVEAKRTVYNKVRSIIYMNF